MTDSKRAKLFCQFGFDLSVKLVGNQGDTHSGFERLAAVVARPVQSESSAQEPKLNHANMQSKLSSGA